MDAATSPHPTDRTLGAYGLGKLDDGPAEAVNKHLEHCPDCRKRVAEITADSFLGRVRDARKPADVSTFGTSRAQAAAPPPADTLPPGLADHPDYEIKRELGRGGMGVVYHAHNALMGRDEVLKVMGRNIIDRPGVLDRFHREIRAVAKLRHPNIVSAYTALRLGDSIVFAMEYVDGLDLARLVKAKGPLPVAHAAYFAHQSALGLQHAHEEGLVHRDIKPANLMLARKGERSTIKILDFGLAKVVREEKVDGGLTTEGQALGTPDYIAPEQILNATGADIRADIYSLGGTLFYLLTGRPPFKANSLYDMYQAHISRDADPLNLIRPEIPAELAALVAKMMAKDRARRFQTPGEVAQALTFFFKKANTAYLMSDRDLSRLSLTDARRQSPGRASTQTRPATDARRSIAGGYGGDPAATESRWESMTGMEDDQSSAGSDEEVNPSRHGRRGFRREWVAAGLFSSIVLIALGLIITIKNKEGNVTTVKSDGKRPFTVETDAGAIKFLPTSGKKKATVYPPDRRKLGDVGNGIPIPPPPSVPGPRQTGPAPIPPQVASSGPSGPTAGGSSVPPVPPSAAPPGPKPLQVVESGPFQPSLSRVDSSSWLSRSPDLAKLEENGEIVLSAGANFMNYLMTARRNHVQSSIKIVLAANSGTDAFLGLRASRQNGAWVSASSRIHDDGGRITVGGRGLNFDNTQTSGEPRLFAPGEYITLEFRINEKFGTMVFVNGVNTQNHGHTAIPQAGAVGVFVKSGSLRIRSLVVADH